MAMPKQALQNNNKSMPHYSCSSRISSKAYADTNAMTLQDCHRRRPLYSCCGHTLSNGDAGAVQCETCKCQCRDYTTETHLSVIAKAILFGNGNADAVRGESSEFHGHKVACGARGALRHIPLHDPHASPNNVPCMMATLTSWTSHSCVLVWVVCTIWHPTFGQLSHCCIQLLCPALSYWCSFGSFLAACNLSEGANNEGGRLMCHLPGVRSTLDMMVGPPSVRKTTAPRLATSCHLPKVRALTPKILPAANKLTILLSGKDQNGTCQRPEHSLQRYYLQLSGEVKRDCSLWIGLGQQR